MRLEVVVLLSILLIFSAAAAVAVVGDDEARDRAFPPAPAAACLPKPGRVGPTIDLDVDPASSDVGRLLGLAKQAGAGVISTTADWSVVRPEAGDRYRWGPLTRLVERARDLGLELRVRLEGMPRWAQDAPTGAGRPAPRSPTELRRWGRFVLAFMRHFDGQVTYVEVWHHPDTRTGWPSGPDPAEFVRLLRRSTAAVDAVNLSVDVVSGSLAGNDLGFLDRVYDVLDADPSAPLPFDLVGVEPFSGDRPPGEVTRVSDGGPFGDVDHGYTGFRRLHEVMVDHGDTRTPLYIGAFGYSTAARDGVDAVPDAQRAAYLTDALRAATCSPYVQVLSWYALAPTADVAPTWTLLDVSLRPNRTYGALARWSVLAAAAAAGGP